MENQNADIAIAFGAATVRDTTKTDEAYVEELYDEYAESLFRYALALTGCSEDAEDVVQSEDHVSDGRVRGGPL